MAYEMTPRERLQRAAMLRAQREARLGYTPTVTEDLSRYLITPTEQSVGSVAPVASQPQNDVGANALESVGKHVATGLDLGANVGIGALKSLEGIFDIGASLVGTVGGWFSEDFKREVEKVVAYQAVNELIENPLDELGLKHSYLNDSEIGEFVGGVAQGVGGMLPAVLVTVATAGTTAPVAVQQALSLGTMIAGAAGNASEEALNDGANLGQATNYGLVSGAIEGATEKLTGGASKWLIGKGIIKGSDVAEQGVKRILKNMGEEAVEEGAATFLNPAAKTTYKGAEALKEYGDIEFYGDVFKDSASGALTAGAFEQTVGRVMHHAGADADISDAQDAVNNLLKKQRADQAKGVYDNAESDADVMANLENISKTLKKASPEKRANLIERHDLSQAFTESGDIKPEFAASFNGGTNTAPNGTTGRGYNRAFYSASLRGSEAKIASDVERIQESLRNVERNRLEQNGLDSSGAENVTVKVFDGELSETGKTNLANAHGFINNVSDRTNTGMNMVAVDTGGQMNGAVLVDGNTVYIDASTIEDGTYLKTMVEEVAHFSEGSKSYGKLLSFLAKDEDLFSEVVGDLVADGNGYGFTTDTFLSLAEKSEAGDSQSLTGEEKRFANELGAHMVAETFGNETFMQKVIKGEPTLAEKMIARVKALKNALSGNESAEARTERKRLEKAEKLWMKSVEDAGYKYIKGKLIKRRREEEEKKKAASSTENVQEAEGESGAQFSLVGKSKDGRNIYKSNYPENTPKAVKQAEIIRLVQEVWSKNPIELTIVDNGKERKITAKFNPDLSERSDLSKIAFGNRKGNASEKRITLDLSSDLYHIAETSTYVRSKEEIGKDNPAHDGVLEWHYFVTNLIYEDFDGKKFDCHMNIDVKEKNDGTWFYSFAIEKGVAPQTLLAVVTDESATTPNAIIHQSSSKINPSKQNSSEKDSQNAESGAQFNLPVGENNVDIYTEEQYNSFGWAVRAKCMTPSEIDDLYSKIQEKGSLRKFKQSQNGYSIVEVNNDPRALLGVDNVFAFVSGTAKSFNVEYVIRFNIFNETELDKFRRNFYGFYKKYSIQRAEQSLGNYLAEGLFLGYTRTDWDSYQQYRESLGERSSRDEGERDAGIDRIGDGGKGNSKTVEGDVTTHQFSLPNKGGEAKKKAERSRSNSTQKYYLRDEISSAVDAIVAEQMNFGERNGVLDFKTKREVVRQVWEKLNSASDDRERARIADDLADYIIDRAVAQKVLSKEDSTYLESAKRVMHKLDLDDIKPQIAEKLGKQTSAYMVWGKRRGGESISLADAKKIFAESGIELQATDDAEIFFEIIDRYNEIKQWIRDESTTFKKSISSAEFSETKKAITEDLLSFADKSGSPANFSRMVEQYERRIDRLNSRLKEQYESARLIREVVFRADRLKKLQLGKMHNAAEFNPQEFRKMIGALGSIVRGGNLSVKKTREVSGKLAAWLRWHMKQIDERLAEDEGRKFELNKIVAYLDEITDPTLEGSSFSVDELKNLAYAMARLTTYASEYGKIIRNGKKVDALPIVSDYIDRSNNARKISRGALRGLREWYIGKFADPATVMRYADGYDEHGFFTETFNEFREGAIKVEVTRMELMEAYVEFLDKHKKYEDHLREYVEYRGKRVPRNVLISLWMTTKRKQAQLGLVMEGAQFRAEPDTKAAKKTDDGTRVFDIAPFGDPARNTKTDPYTNEEIETIMDGIRTEIEKSFTDTDRSYIAMVEGIFKECGEIKRGVDMERLGYTNVDEKQYYFPIARADIAQTIEQESWQQGLDRVSHLSMNKDTVKGAHNRLYLSGVDAILMRHVNQVALYNGIANAVDNFNLLVNLKINADGASITVNNTVSRTDYGKAALDYLKKLKQDIERVNRVDIDDAGVTKFLSYLRGAYATSVLGANLKVWVTQASSLIAAGNVLDGKSIAEGMALPMGKIASSSVVGRSATRILPGMTAQERYEVLKNKRITPTQIQIADGFDVDWAALEKNRKSVVEKPLLQKMKALGFLRNYNTDSIDIGFEFTGGGLRKSMNSQVSDYGGNLGDLAKVVMNLQPLLDNAVLIEVHSDKAKGTAKENARLLQTYVFLSAYAEGNTVTPVQFEVKQYVDDQNRLYLAVAMTKIETGVLGDTAPRNEERTRLIPVSDISIARLIENINPSDENFFKYVPDNLLTEEQRKAKRRALVREAKKYGKTIDELLEERGESDTAIEKKSKESKIDEVDVYCPLAKLRNDANTAYEAQSVSARVPNALRKTSEVLMKPIGAVDRFVIERLWGACQVQVQSKGGAKVGTKENKTEAGKLLQKVILETQQNSLATERSSAMRSTNEILKSVTMFSADAMKMIGRFFDAYGEAHVIRQKLKDQTLSKEERAKLEARKKVVDKQVVKSTSVLLSSAVFMMAIAAAFKAILGQYEEKEPEEIALDMTADGVGNILSGLPLLRDVYSFYAEGYELNMNVITYVNGLMEAVGAFGTNISNLTSGKEVTSQAWASSIRKGFYAGGQILGLPTKNVYKYATRVIELVFPETGYAIDAAFTKPSIKADLKKAIEAGDTKMVARIAEIATSENYGMYSESTRKELKPLVEAGYTVFPRTVGDTVTVDGETYELSSEQKKRFAKVYAVSDKAVEELVKLKQFKGATDEVKAKALKYVYDTYYSVALDDLMGTDTTQKSVLFAEVIDIEKLAMIVSHVSTLTADKDKEGKNVSGSRKQKIVAYVNSLNLSAAEKYMVMGYLGYKNVHGETQVKALVNRSGLSKEEKAIVLSHCGYAA